MQSGDTRNCVGSGIELASLGSTSYLFVYLNICVREFVNIYMNIMQQKREACTTSVLYDTAACSRWRVVTSVNAVSNETTLKR